MCKSIGGGGAEIGPFPDGEPSDLHFLVPPKSLLSVPSSPSQSFEERWSST
jgi:hypothetical protein